MYIYINVRDNYVSFVKGDIQRDYYLSNDALHMLYNKVKALCDLVRFDNDGTIAVYRRIR